MKCKIQKCENKGNYKRENYYGLCKKHKDIASKEYKSAKRERA
jgi:hypothetical protein